ncbi:MAG TPA: GNAT family N-acetyltransferase [Dehalococcoidia bacterium]|nr:GNAT family N-acetyltransferase [Dehalococcoidia bacterium]
MKTDTGSASEEVRTITTPPTKPATDWAASGYPKQVPLRDDSEALLRPLAEGDEDRLLAFFQQIPEAERFFLKDDVTSPAVLKGWVRDTERAFALVAEASGRIVGEAALVRRRGKARGHLADVRVVVAEDFRNRGLGTALLSELCDVARDSELNGVLFEAVESVQAQALAAADSLGFVRLGRVYGGAIDQAGHLHDVILLAMPLRRWRHSEF